MKDEYNEGIVTVIKITDRIMKEMISEEAGKDSHGMYAASQLRLALETIKKEARKAYKKKQSPGH